MLVCSAPELVSWRPDFSSSEQRSPRWTRLICDGEQLSNALNAVEWLDDEPAVQVELCESCGCVGCGGSGYVHISRIGRHVLWTPPHVDSDDPFESWDRTSEPVQRLGSIAIPVEIWDAWRRKFESLPPAEEFPQTLRRDLLAAWRAEAPIFNQFDSRERLVELALARAVAADPSGLGEALAGLESVADWFAADPDGPVAGTLVSVSIEEVAIETIYFDVPDTFDRPVLREWRPIGRMAGGLSPVFGGEIVLLPPPG